MRLLLDQDVYGRTIAFLRSLGHDIVLAADIGMSSADDVELLQYAHDDSRIFITRDSDFGNLVFINRLGAGVIYLRILIATINVVHQELNVVLTKYSEDDLRHAFVVVEPGKHRFRKLRS